MSKGRRVKNKKEQKKHETAEKNDNKEKSEDCEMKITGIGENLNALFRIDEIQDLKKILNLKDLTDLPLLLGAVVLSKFDIVKKLLKDGHPINDDKTNHITPIMWAVKNKNLEMVDLLLARGADINMIDKNGDNAILLAVESIIWNEQAFIDFWNGIKQKNQYNINCANKFGNNILHFAVKRQWTHLVDLLIDNKINVNCKNIKGVTPLIMASSKNNSQIVNSLINAGADLSHEDDQGCTALCYAVSFIIQKRMDPTSSPVIEKLISIMNANESELSSEVYLRRRIELIVSSDTKCDFAHVISSIIVPIFIFFIRNTQSGIEMLLELNVFNKLREAAEKHIDSPEYISGILFCVFELVRYCKCCVGGGLSCVTENQIMDTFILSGGADMCLWILKRNAPISNNHWLIVPALMPLFVACVTEGKPRFWLQIHFRALLPFYQQFLEMCVASYSFMADENHIKAVKRKIRTFRTLMTRLQNDENICNQKQAKTYESPGPKLYVEACLKGKHRCEIELPQSAMQQMDTKEVTEVIDQQRKTVTLDEYLSHQDNQKPENRSSSKRMKRKTKAWKAKIAKIRSAVVAERVISKPDLIQNISDDKKTEQMKQDYDEVQELNSSEQTNVPKWSAEDAEWQTDESFQKKMSTEKLNDNSFDGTINMNLKTEQDSSSDGVASDDELTERQISTMDLNTSFPEANICYFSEEIENNLAPKIQYLTLLFEDIVARYERNWRTDKELGYPDFQGGQGDSYDSMFTGSREEQIQKLGEILPQLESVYLTRLREKFMEVLIRIKQIAYDRDMRYIKLIEQLQMTLLNHEVRGETALTNGVATRNYYEFVENAYSTKCWTKNPKHETMNVEKYVKEKEEEYIKQMINLSKTKTVKCQEEIDAIKQKTEESAYHLIDSVERLLDSSTSVSSKDDGSESEHNFDELFPYSTEITTSVEGRQSYKISKKTNEININIEQTTNVTKIKNHDSCANNFFNILSNSKSRRTKPSDDNNNTLEVNNSSMATFKYQSPVISPQVASNTFWKKSQVSSIPIPGQHSYVSRWEVAVTNLRNCKNLNLLACGELRTSPQNARLHFMVSSGGNFGDVELGLDVHCRALAVKRVPKQNNIVCKILKAAMNPLLGLRHKHLLHYAVCDYDETQLLIASPLCEYNMGEYLMCLKMNHSLINSATSLARQLLVGLRYLHERTMPIVHGNLKPSNVLIDSAGVLKLAEFGVYRALYQTVRPPKSSIIWFARETYEHYEKTSIMSCTTYSDIQVAGMLLHFILTGGLHPFGIVAEDILENIVRGAPDLKTIGCDLIDLISWMLIYEPSERPSVSQVLSHVYFWDSERKWRFLLACAGITQHGSPIPVSLNHLHSTLDASAARDQIKGDWVSVVKVKFPGMRLPEGSFSDTPTGLLRFLRACTEERQLNSRSFGGIDLQTFFIEAFPALPLSLFRLLETTEWLKHPVFSPFTIATS